MTVHYLPSLEYAFALPITLQLTPPLLRIASQLPALSSLQPPASNFQPLPTHPLPYTTNPKPHTLSLAERNSAQHPLASLSFQSRLNGHNHT